MDGKAGLEVSCCKNACSSTTHNSIVSSRTFLRYFSRLFVERSVVIAQRRLDSISVPLQLSRDISRGNSQLIEGENRHFLFQIGYLLYVCFLRLGEHFSMLRRKCVSINTKLRYTDGAVKVLSSLRSHTCFHLSLLLEITPPTLTKRISVYSTAEDPGTKLLL